MWASTPVSANSVLRGRDDPLAVAARVGALGPVGDGGVGPAGIEPIVTGSQRKRKRDSAIGRPIGISVPLSYAPAERSTPSCPTDRRPIEGPRPRPARHHPVHRVLDASIVNVALPSIGKDLDFSRTTCRGWSTPTRSTFGGFLLLGGRLADLLGRRRIFIVGLIVFGVGSLGGGLAQSDVQLVAARGAPGPRRRDHLPRRAGDRDHHLRRGRRAQQGARRLGRGGGRRRRRRRAARRRAHRVPGLGVGAAREHADRARGRLPGPAAAGREPRRRAPRPSTSPAP